MPSPSARNERVEFGRQIGRADADELLREFGPRKWEDARPQQSRTRSLKKRAHPHLVRRLVVSAAPQPVRGPKRTRGPRLGQIRRRELKPSVPPRDQAGPATVALERGNAETKCPAQHLISRGDSFADLGLVVLPEIHVDPNIRPG
ncbi:MAG TPA: hypothetical protein VFJ16_14910 [Longimicrobium sp.]|nr:hypothetical protein [Longimicrobium sp.]